MEKMDISVMVGNGLMDYFTDIVVMGCKGLTQNTRWCLSPAYAYQTRLICAVTYSESNTDIMVTLHKQRQIAWYTKGHAKKI